MSDFYLDPGDWLCCEQGHRNWRVIKPIAYGDACSSADVVGPYWEHPKPGPFANCWKCDGPVIIVGPLGGYLPVKIE